MGKFWAKLEKLHPSLCAACQNSTLCSANDEFAGDEGALRCLFAGYGEVAFTSTRSVERYLASDRFDRRTLSNYKYLCLDGSKLALDGRACEWAHKPTNVFVTDPSRHWKKSSLLRHLSELFYRFVAYKPSWWHMRSLLSHPSQVTQILPVPSHLQRWDTYLGNFISSIEKPLPNCESPNVTVCTSSALEELKCLDLQKAAFSLRVRPEIHCKRRPNKHECLELVAAHQADLASIELSTLHEAPPSLVHALEPIGVAQPSSADYSVALVRVDSRIRFLHDLAGRRSCHGSYGDMAGWWSPLSVLSERALLDQAGCNKADQVADYFGGSCVPGAADLRVNQYRSGSERLCALCRGDSSHQHQCERSHSERYYGKTGALRCLVDGAGEVAFMSSSQMLASVDGRSLESWARDMPLALDSRNFRLICRSGPSMALDDFERCHLTRLPAKILVSNRFQTKEDRLINRHLLTLLEDKFLNDNQQMFELFGPYHNQSDLLFDDLTSKLIPQRLEMSTFDLLTRQHFDPSYQQLPFLNRAAQNCKLVVATSGASATAARIYHQRQRQRRQQQQHNFSNTIMIIFFYNSIGVLLACCAVLFQSYTLL